MPVSFNALGGSETLSTATGWQPEIPLSQTLKETLDYWRAKL